MNKMKMRKQNDNLNAYNIYTYIKIYINKLIKK